MEKGTLEELNVKAGDVVRYLGWGDSIYFGKDQVETITDDMKINTKMGLLDVDIPAHDFTIVSRASDTPKLEGDSSTIKADKPSEAQPKLWCDMTPEEKGALLLAHHEGKAIEDLCLGQWGVSTPVCFLDNVAYRIKPEPKKPREWFALVDKYGDIVETASYVDELCQDWDDVVCVVLREVLE